MSTRIRFSALFVLFLAAALACGPLTLTTPPATPEPDIKLFDGETVNHLLLAGKISRDQSMARSPQTPRHFHPCPCPNCRLPE